MVQNEDRTICQELSQSQLTNFKLTGYKDGDVDENDQHVIYTLGSSTVYADIQALTTAEISLPEDAVGNYHSWFKESLIFGCVWACWHLPLFFVPGTYHYGLREMGLIYVINFLVSAIPVDFLQTWVYVKNNRSMLATMIFHLFLNVMQEKIAMTPETKIIETGFMIVAAALIVFTNKKMFFSTDHVGRLLEVQENSDNEKKK